MQNVMAGFLTIVVLASALFAAEPFELKQGDRVAFIGDALIERDIQYNYLETALSARFHGRGVVFRNIGWSGDTVWGESRAVFGPPADGYKALVKMIGEVQPTVAFLNYGMNESFAGPAGLAHFEAGYNTLLDDLEKTAKGVRIVLLSPIAFRDDEASSQARNLKQNENLRLYTDSIRKLAAARNARFVDLFAVFTIPPAVDGKGMFVKPTTDGMHLNAAGYQMFSHAVERGLELTPSALAFASSTAGDYDPVTAVADTPLGKLRAVIAAKNLQFFNRWRPQNETYLFLFRKHEQGKNAKDIPEFDPIIAAQEAEIGKLAEALGK